jgi:phage replication O-like protein O
MEDPPVSAVVLEMIPRAPQLEDGFTRLANDLLDALVRAGLTARQWTVVMALVRKTYGFNKREDDIGLSQLVAMTGLDKANISRTLRELVEQGIVHRSVGKHGHILSINKRSDQWGLSDRQRLSIQQRGVAKTTTGMVAKSTTTIDNHQKTTPKDKNLCAPQAKRGDGDQGEQSERADQPGRAKTSLSAVMQDRFNRFYAAYPKKRSKLAAQKAFAKLAPSEDLLAEMLTAIDRAKATEQWALKGMTPHPSTWLNAGGWMDEVQIAYSAEEVEVIEVFNEHLGDIAGTVDPAAYIESRAAAIRALRALSSKNGKTERWRAYFPWVRDNVDLPPHTGFDYVISPKGFQNIVSGQFSKQ